MRLDIFNALALRIVRASVKQASLGTKNMEDIARLRYRNYDWKQPFDSDEYCRNPKAITMLYEAWLKAEFGLAETHKENESLKSRLSELEKSYVLLE